MSLDVRRVQDEAALREYQSVLAAALPYDLVGFPPDPLEDLQPLLSGVVNTNPIEAWVGYADGVPVAAADLVWCEHDNLDTGHSELRVHPEYRRQGHGSAMLEQLTSRLSELGRNRLYFDAPSVSHGTSPSPADHMAAALGARPILVEHRRSLDPQELDESGLEALRVEVLAGSMGYTALSWMDRVPPEYHDDMAELMVAMSTDAPQGDVEFEAEQWDAARYRDWEEGQLSRGRQRLVSVVRNDASGRLVGFTDLGRAKVIPDVAFQWSTLVREEHRGHRLGMLLKLANLAQLRREVPTVRHLNTWNAADNTWMIAVNEAVGFTVMEAWTKYELPVR